MSLKVLPAYPFFGRPDFKAILISTNMYTRYNAIQVMMAALLILPAIAEYTNTVMATNKNFIKNET